MGVDLSFTANLVTCCMNIIMNFTPHQVENDRTVNSQHSFCFQYAKKSVSLLPVPIKMVLPL